MPPNIFSIDLFPPAPRQPLIQDSNQQVGIVPHYPPYRPLILLTCKGFNMGKYVAPDEDGKRKLNFIAGLFSSLKVVNNILSYSEQTEEEF